MESTGGVTQFQPDVAEEHVRRGQVGKHFHGVRSKGRGVLPASQGPVGFFASSAVQRK